MIWLLLALGCTEPEPVAPEFPTLMVTPAHKPAILGRVGDEPWASMLEGLQEMAGREWRDRPEPDVWHAPTSGHNASTARASAFLAWLYDDEAHADKAREFLGRMDTDYATHDDWDINIRMPEPLMGWTDTVDLLRGTPWLPEDEERAAIDAITSINDAFFRQYVEDDATRGALLGFTQNNHPIRTAAATGYVAFAFPDEPMSEEQATWAISELDYLWGAGGQYVQLDGGVSEGPFYYGFAFAPSVAFFIMMDNAITPWRVYERDCRNRVDVDPWAGHGCVEGDPFLFDNPLHSELFAGTVAWWIAIRQPSGLCPPLADAYFNPHNGGALLTSFGADPWFRWSWEAGPERPMEMAHGYDLLAHHLAYVSPSVQAAPPPYETVFLPLAGNAVLRSGWDRDARWLLLVAESGSARKTVHDHVDGTSFSMAAYGEYLLVDPGYYKPEELTLPHTAQANAHNVVLVDGAGAPFKGLLTDFGDADATLEHGYDGDIVDYVEAHQRYREVDFERSALLLRDRYYVIADRLRSDDPDSREFSWRLGGYAGLEAGGAFTLRADGASWERELAGVDVYLASTAAGLVVEEPPYTPFRAPHVHQFALNREIGHHAVIDGVVHARQPGFVAVLAPYRVGDDGQDGPLEVAAVATGDGAAAWDVGGDLVWLRDSAGPASLSYQGVTLETDAELVVLGAGLMVIVRGTALDIDGTTVGVGDPDGVTVLEAP